MALVGALPTLSWVENFTTAHLRAAEPRWSATATLWDQSFTQLASDMLRPGGTEWEGPAADTAQDNADKAGITARAGANQLHDAAGIATFGADQLDGLHAKTLDAIAEARHDGFQVNKDLSVTDTQRHPWGSSAYAARQAAAEEYAETIQSYAGQLLALDNEYAAKLNAATEGLDTLTLDAPGGDTSPANGHNGIQFVGNHTFKQGPTPEPGTPDNPTSPLKPIHTGQDVKDLLDSLERGSKKVRQVEWPEDVQRLYDWLTRNSVRDAPRSNYDGPRRALPDGTEIGIRPDSKSGGPTVDVLLPDGSTRKVHLPQAPIIGAPPELPPATGHAPVGIPPAVVDHPPVAIPPASQPTPALPPWLQDPSPPGFQVTPGEPPPIAPWDIPDAPPAPPMPSPEGPPITLPSLPAPPPEAAAGAGGLAAVGAAILAGLGWLAHPFGQ